MQAAESFSRRFKPAALTATFVAEVGISSAVGIDKVTGKKFRDSLTSEIDLISVKALNGSYNFTNYRQLLMTKGPAEPPRELCIPTIRDKVTLKALSNVLDDVYGEACKTPQPQPIVQALFDNLRKGEFDSYVKLDIKRFYASVDHNMLFRVLRRKIRKKELLSIIERAISTPSTPVGMRARKRRTEGIPEGLPISNKLANIYVESIDAAFAADKAVKYYRYVDDIIVLCNSYDIERVEQTAERLVKRLSLELHPEKKRSGFIGKSSYEYLGYVFRVGGIAPRKKSVLNLTRWLESHMRAYRNTNNKRYWQWKLCLRITGCRITEDGVSFNRFGWLFYFSQSTDAALPHKLDALVVKFAKRYGVDLPNDLPTFSRSYYEIHYRNGEGSYIQLIDFSIDSSRKREILFQLYGGDFVRELTEDNIDAVFKRRMLQEAKTLERDVGATS